MKEKLEYLEHEDIGTMEKKIAQRRKEEVQKEKEKIASLEFDKRKISGKTAPGILQTTPEEKNTSFPLSEGLSLVKKITIRIFYLFLFSAIVYSVYYFSK